MKDEEKAKEILEKVSFNKYVGESYLPSDDSENCEITCGFVKNMIVQSAIEMAQWKDEQYKIAYVITRSDLHYDEVERVFFDKNKAEEYCKSYNEDENSYHRDITKIEVSL